MHIHQRTSSMYAHLKQHKIPCHGLVTRTQQVEAFLFANHGDTPRDTASLGVMSIVQLAHLLHRILTRENIIELARWAREEEMLGNLQLLLIAHDLIVRHPDPVATACTQGGKR
jgi:hypothetical protein